MQRHTGAVLGMLILAYAAAAQFIQQGSKLVGTGAVGAATQGSSVAISADGTTAIVGGPNDNSSAGAAWVYTRSEGVWSQQGTKLVGTGAIGAAFQGASVSISADGNTAIIGGPGDNSEAGAAWVFTRSGGAWSQQGRKLVGTDAVGPYPAMQGWSVAISAGGNTAIVGGPEFTYGPWSGGGIFGGPGAAWAFTRSGGVWSQQGSKLVGMDAGGPWGPEHGGVRGPWGSEQGTSVAISADGNTAIVGGLRDISWIGAAWVFTRSGGVWTQQGPKLVGTGAVGAALQGASVAVSADGNTAIVGGPDADFPTGAAWVFTRSGGAWSQWGKLVGTGALGPYAAGQGESVAISADGTTAIVGGSQDNSGVGAAWVFVATDCAAPSIVVQPQSQSIRSGLTARLSVTATGATPLSYQWYQGASGDTSQPVGSNTASFTTPPLTATTSYWVRVANSCGQADSATAIVSTFICTAPSITAQPQSQSIHSGQTATLSVTATGTAPLNYLWYQGASGDTTQPVGYYPSSFTTPTLTATTSYWVRVFNACGQAADSATATVTVGPPYANVVWVPVAAHNPGLNQSQWRSDLGLLNTGTVTDGVLIAFYGSDRIVANTTYVPPGLQSVLTDVVGQLGASGQGALQILSDQPLKVTSRTYNQVPSDASCYPNGTQGQDYPVIVASDGLSAGESAYLAGLAENAAYRCNIGLVNVGSGAATVLVELYSGAGTKLTDYRVSLASEQWAQETQPFKNKVGQSAMDRGYAKITVQTGSGVFAFASVVDNLTNDPTTVAMQR